MLDRVDYRMNGASMGKQLFIQKHISDTLSSREIEPVTHHTMVRRGLDRRNVLKTMAPHMGDGWGVIYFLLFPTGRQ